MKLDFLDKDDYSDILIHKMKDNNHGDLPFFIRKYSQDSITPKLHRHEFMQINYINQGKGKHILNNREFEVLKGDIFVIPPYIPHCISSSPDYGIEVFEFEFISEFINQYMPNIENAEAFFDFAYIEPFLVSENMVKPRLNLRGKVQENVEDMLGEALAEYNKREPGYMLLIKSLLLKILVIVGREFTRIIDGPDSCNVFTRHRDAIWKAVDYLNEHYYEQMSVEEVAKKFILSQSYFSYLFKSITSKSFIEYLNNIRISKAMELLKATDKKIIEICYDTGFNNVNHFNRIFRQHIGVSPMAYRKTVR